MTIEREVINTIKVLSAEAIQKANSGHPGLPLGTADLAYELWSKKMVHSPNNPKWQNRDRFILSAGHGSMLQYSLLHLFGYDVSIDDIQNFRQLGSKTPGHPEYGLTEGIEATTGPLGQGVANGVGMAIAEKMLSEQFNREGFNIVDHYTYVLAGDGCMMEGISSEACSLAGTLGLEKLILIYDSNNISIEGDTDLAFREDVMKRFEAYQWQTIEVKDGMDREAFSKAIDQAKSEKDKPTLIKVNTIIGNGCKAKEGKAEAHGAPLGEENIDQMKEALNMNSEKFYVSENVKNHMDVLNKKLNTYEAQWNELFSNYQDKYPELADEYCKWMNNDYSLEFFEEELFDFKEALATRKASAKVIQSIAENIPNFVGGSADLAPSTKTHMDGKGEFSKENRSGQNMHFGVREFAMGAIVNGMELHGGLMPFAATFFVFSDYMKPALRLAAIMEIPVKYVLTHDSIGVGEDGPTHQPIEQLAMLRSIPNFNVIRPADSTETAIAWKLALDSKKTPTALVLTRQTLPVIEETSSEALKGGYILNPEIKDPDILLMASGSEVSLILQASKALAEEDINARVISIPCFEIFEAQGKAYVNKIIDRSVNNRLAVEAGTDYGWYKYLGDDGQIISMDTFGESGPGNEVFNHFGFNVENIVDKVKNMIK